MNIQCAHDELVDLVRLQPNPRNPNKHPKRQIDMLAKIISYQGQRAPIVVSKRSGFIVKGHGRLEAIKTLGWEKAAVDFQDYEDEAQEFADMIADNKIAELAEHDDELMKLTALELKLDNGFDLDLLGIPDLDLSVPDPSKEATEDDVPEPTKSISVLGDLYELGEHRLMCGDSTSIDAVEKLMVGKLVDLVFTSPPYGQQRDYGAAKEKVQEWDALMRDVFSIVPAKDDAQLLVNLGLIHRECEWIPYWDKWIEFMRQANWKRFGLYVWDQGPGLPGDWNGRLAPAFELIFHFCKKPKQANKTHECKMAGVISDGGLRNKDGSIGGRSAGASAIQDMKIPDSVVRVMRHKGGLGSVGSHPAIFSVALADEIISAYSNSGDVLYEPFAGSGTVCIAAEKLNRVCYMMELDPHYIDVIVTRWCKYTGKTSIKRNGEPMEWTI